jgi:wyosine [tRNA(Phe)-imidazoG37] synthetase (radical SAM superfamily)
MLHKAEIREALLMVDNNLLKLDAGTEAMIRKINMPLKAFRLEEYIRQLQRFNGNLTIQSLFLKGVHNGEAIDNTTIDELNAWLQLLQRIRPKQVMIYTIERDTPEEHLQKITTEELESIAQKTRDAGFEAEVFA